MNCHRGSGATSSLPRGPWPAASAERQRGPRREGGRQPLGSVCAEGAGGLTCWHRLTTDDGAAETQAAPGLCGRPELHEPLSPRDPPQAWAGRWYWAVTGNTPSLGSGGPASPPALEARCPPSLQLLLRRTPPSQPGRWPARGRLRAASPAWSPDSETHWDCLPVALKKEAP